MGVVGTKKLSKVFLKKVLLFHQEAILSQKKLLTIWVMSVYFSILVALTHKSPKIFIFKERMELGTLFFCDADSLTSVYS